MGQLLSPLVFYQRGGLVMTPAGIEGWESVPVYHRLSVFHFPGFLSSDAFGGGGGAGAPQGKPQCQPVERGEPSWKRTGA